MKQNVLKYTAIALGLCVATVAQAQDLSTEVVVDRTVDPTERAASRLGSLTPQLVLPTVNPSALPSARYTNLTALTRSYSRLDPARGAYAAYNSPYKGYFRVGYFPTLNLEAAAGYRFIDTEKAMLGANLDFHGTSYKPFEEFDAKQSYWNARVAVNGAYRPDKVSQFQAGISYEYLRQHSLVFGPQTIGTFNFGALWESQAAGLDYKIGGDIMLDKSGKYGYDPDINGRPVELDGYSQPRFTLMGEISREFQPGNRFGLGITADIVNNGDAVYEGGISPAYTGMLGFIDFEPFYALVGDNISARVGVKLDLGSGGESKNQIAPDITIQWAPSSQVGLWAEVTGGEVLNTDHEFRHLSPFLMGSDIGYDRSKVKYKALGGLNFGPFTGFSAGIYGGYAKASNWYMVNYDAEHPLMALNITGWTVGLRLGYENRLLTASLDAAIAPGDGDKAWLDNRDRAKYVVKAAVDVRPIDRLTVGLGYDYRGGRSMYGGSSLKSMGHVSDLSLRAAYSVSPRFSVYARAENILGHQYSELPMVYSQKQHGAIGFEVKF